MKTTLRGVALLAAALLTFTLMATAIGGLDLLGRLDLRGAANPAENASTREAGAETARSAAGEQDTKPPARPQHLQIRTAPVDATLRIQRPDGSVRNARTPFDDRVLGGELSLEISKDGYNTVRQPLTLDEDQSFKVWLDPAGQLHRKVGAFETGSNPKQVAFTPDGEELWVTPLGGGGVEVYDVDRRKLVERIPLDEHGSVEVIFSSDGRRAYVSQMETATVYEIDTGRRKIRQRLPTEGSWTKVMALSPDERTLYAANWSSHDVSEINLRNGKVRRRLQTVATPRGLWVTPDGERLFVAGFENGEIERIDLETEKAEVLLRTGGAMRHLVADAEGEQLYADDMATNETYVVDVDSEEVSKLADTDAKPNTIDLDTDGRVLYVSNRGENGESYYLPGPEWGSVLAIDARTGEYLDAIVGGNQTTGLDVSPDGKLLAFSDFLDNRVQLYEVPEQSVLLSGGGGRAGEHRADLVKD